MEKRLVVLGGGGHALVVVDAAREAGWDVLGFADPDANAVCVKLVPHLGDEGSLAKLDAWAAVIGVGSIGDPRVRMKIAAKLSPPRGFAAIVHPRAVVARSVEVGAGALVAGGAVVNPLARIGEHAIVNTSAVVEHGVDVGAFAHVAPRSVLGGDCKLGARAHVGIGAIVREGITVGEGAIIGAGAVVIRDVPAGVTVVGCPARPIVKPAAS